MSTSTLRTSRRSPARGFTLIEVMVALAIVALGMSALLEALSVSAGNVAALRDKTVAEWIAMNKIADARLTLNVPTLGSSEGDIDDCARGTWHWRQEIDAVAALPGLVSITVSVRRTGNAAPKPGGSRSSSVNRGLGATGPLGPTAPLGSVTTFGASGCVAAADPGSSLGGTPALGIGAPPTLGAPASLGSAASPQLGQQSQTVGSLGVTGTSGSSTTGANAGGGPSGAFGSLLGSGGPGSAGNGTQSSNSSDGSGSSSSAGHASEPSWLVTLTGFRGNSLGAANGEGPNWTTSLYAGTGGQSGIPNNNNGATNGAGGLTPGTNTNTQPGGPAPLGTPTPPGTPPGLP